jgi:drug/metabolite transporter (DMT)-like permease
MGLAWLMLHERPTFAQTAGASMIVGGLLLARLQIFEPAEP